MLLRSITKHIKDQNWFAVVLDFVIVVVGILIAFQITNWNEAQSDKRVARQYIERIQEDLLANQVSIKSRVEYLEGIREHGIRALSALNGPPEELGEVFLIDAFQASNTVGTSLARDAYDELLAVGAINIISDVQIRQHLARFYQSNAGLQLLTRNVPAYRDALRSAMPYDVQAAIRTHCTPIVETYEAGIKSIAMPKSCVPELTDEQVQRAVTAVYEAKLKNHLNRAVADTHEKLQVAQAIEPITQRLYDILEASK